MSSTFTPYQVDYTQKNASKKFGFSKKRVSFKFGVANNEAISQGMTGANCRGSEHEVIFIWSLNSGKRQILADGKDVHFSESRQNGWTSDQVFQHQFALRVPGFSTPLRCQLITQPTNRDVPSIHPFDLRVNGISFFAFSKIFQLGTPSAPSRPVGGRGYDDAYVTPEERKAIAAAKLASIRDFREQQASQSNRDEGNLIDFFDAPAAPASAPQMPPPQQNSQFVSSMTMDSVYSGNSPQTQTQAPPPAYGGQPAYNNYALPPQQAPVPQSAYQPPPAYGQPPAPYGQPPPNALTPSYGQQAYQPGFASPPPNNMASPTNQTVISYGSAPTFAQPPQQQQTQGYPQY